MGVIRVIELGRLGYRAAYERQVAEVEGVLASRKAGRPEAGRLLLVEHDPVVTVTRRAGARDHVLASDETLGRAGVELVETDRGGDVTYHGPGQLVAYPILDLNRLNLGLHAYMRLLEDAVIAACGRLGVPAERDASATGVWVRSADGAQSAKICAMGVRVRKWVSMHGLALNVDPRMEHFALIVPCGLHGRPITSLRAERSARGLDAVDMAQVRSVLAEELEREVDGAIRRADRARSAEGGPRFIC